MQYDYVICGAGSAGCVLANRLSEDPANRVLLIEAGGRDWHPMLHVPKGFYFTLSSPRYSWLYDTKPFGPTDRVESWARGKVLGGSSAINGMVYNRGWRADYDAVAALGNPGWGWDDFLPVFRTMEDHELGASDVRGAGGPLHIELPEAEEVCEAVIAAGGKLGWHRSTDLNDSDDERIGYVPSTIKNGLRVSSARAFLHPARRRPNLDVVTDTEVGSLIFDGRRACGVRAHHGGRSHEYRAGTEVIVCLGALESPQLLERSGIGRPEVLDGAKVPVRVESPNVGEGMREHRMITFQHRLKRDIGYNRLLATRLRQAAAGAKYLFTRSGPMSFGGYDIMAIFKSHPDVPRPDAEAFFTPLSLGPNAFASGVAPERPPGLMSPCFALRPESLGSIHITSADPASPAAIAPNYFASEYDRSTSLDVFARMRQLWAQSPLAEMMESETDPGLDLQDADQVLERFITEGGPAYHSLGTCAMGPNDDAVVDSRLKVRGTEGLRVVDASVWPTMISGNCNGPTMALAWKAADVILGDR